MKTIIIGGGRGCKSILGMAAGAYLKELELDIIAVVDENNDAPGMEYAREAGIATLNSIEDAIKLSGVELIIELTGSDHVVRQLYGMVSPGIKILDHTVARIFWDLMNAQEEIKNQYYELQQLERNFESFINSANDWISMKDAEGRYVIVNPATARSFGLKSKDFIGRKPEEVLPQKIVDIINLHDREVKSTKKHHTYEEIYTIDGQDHHFQTVRFPMADYKGDIIGVCTIARDVTREFKLTEQLIQSEKMAALGKLAAGVAHEINNPLTGILAYAEGMLDDMDSNCKHEEDIKMIVRETLKCRDIVRNLLDFAKTGIPKLDLMDPEYVLDQALQLIQKLPQFRDVNIYRSSGVGLPRIAADLQQLQQVILNFMLNAAEAMSYSGSINISTDYEPRNDSVVISISDSGPGIPENLIDKIFEPFFSTKGTNGLGLAVSWGIIERHRGTIEVDTSDSGGAIFRIILPSAERHPER